MPNAEIHIGFESAGAHYNFVDHDLARERYRALALAWQRGDSFHTLVQESGNDAVIRLAAVNLVEFQCRDDADAQLEIRYQVERIRRHAEVGQAVEEQTADLQIQHRVENTKRNQEIEQAVNEQISTVGFRR